MTAPPTIETDIEFNRRGELSPSQAQWISGSEYSSMMVSVYAPFIAIQPLFGVSALAYFVRPWLGAVVFLILVGPFVYGCYRLHLYVRDRQAKSAQDTKKVQRVTGFVAWHAGKWHAFEPTKSGPRPLEAVAAPPGPYYFYLTGTRIVGGESPLGPGWFSIGDHSLGAMHGDSHCRELPIGDDAAFQMALGHTFGFGPSNLEANRRGSLSPSQGSGAVDMHEGAVQLSWEMPTKFTVLLFLVVNGVKLPVSREASQVVPAGLRYRIYCRAGTTTILSLEPVRAPTGHDA